MAKRLQEIDTDTNTTWGQMCYITGGISDGLCNAKQKSLGRMDFHRENDFEVSDMKPKIKQCCVIF